MHPALHEVEGDGGGQRPVHDAGTVPADEGGRHGDEHLVDQLGVQQVPVEAWAALAQHPRPALLGQGVQPGGQVHLAGPRGHHEHAPRLQRLDALGRGVVGGHHDHVRVAGQQPVRAREVQAAADDGHRRDLRLAAPRACCPHLGRRAGRPVLLGAGRARPHEDDVGRPAQGAEPGPVALAAQRSRDTVDRDRPVEAADHVQPHPPRAGRHGQVGVDGVEGLLTPVGLPLAHPASPSWSLLPSPRCRSRRRRPARSPPSNRSRRPSGRWWAD